MQMDDIFIDCYRKLAWNVTSNLVVVFGFSENYSAIILSHTQMKITRQTRSHGAQIMIPDFWHDRINEITIKKNNAIWIEKFRYGAGDFIYGSKNLGMELDILGM